MGAFRSDKQGNLIHAEELERRRLARDPRKSGVQQAVPSVSELRDRYIVLLAARECSPERLSESGYANYDAHQQVVKEFGMDDGEDIYAETVTGHLMRERLREIAPGWFEL